MASVIQTTRGVFDEDGMRAALVGAQQTDTNEVMIEIRALAYSGAKPADPPRASAYLDAIEAVQLGEQLVESGRKALSALVEQVPDE